MFTPKFNQLPVSIPVFPLSGAVVMPGTQLPLNIFEPRYLQMINSVLSGNRIIGMIQPTTIGSDESVLSRIGCAGRITSFNETDDGRFVILLSGLCRFDLGDEIVDKHQFRRFNVNWSRFESDLGKNISFKNDISRPNLMDSVQRFLNLKNVEVNMDSLQKLDDDILVNVLTCGLSFRPLEVQSLIECVSLEERVKLLSGLIEMEIHASPATQSVTH